MSPNRNISRFLDGVVALVALYYFRFKSLRNIGVVIDVIFGDQRRTKRGRFLGRRV